MWLPLDLVSYEWIWIPWSLRLLYITLQRPFSRMFLRAQVHRVFKGIYLVVECSQYPIGYIHLWLYRTMQNCFPKLTFRNNEWESPLVHILSSTWYSHFKFYQSGGYKIVSLCVEITCIHSLVKLGPKYMAYGCKFSMNSFLHCT